MALKWIIALTIIGLCFANEAPPPPAMLRGAALLHRSGDDMVKEEISDFYNGKTTFNLANNYLLMRKTLGSINEDQYQHGLHQLDVFYGMMNREFPPVGQFQENKN
ncbi:unnamed protein product [Blepharisma stoltei]|uniref:Uncharacterized protein n=1 Tax=Blepharisma stoltei TaxID=1481888 RepID=A0AAU9JIT8_9CILI|nr:unnamed protein product [Blepharisma stoltei]